jgi:hypothetical protein
MTIPSHVAREGIFWRHPYAAQIAGVALFSAVLTFLTVTLNYRTGWNLAWMLILPFFLGFLLNRDLERGAFMAMVLPVISFLAVIIAGAMAGGY